MNIRPASSADWEAIRLLLEVAKLPIDDLGADRLEQFLVGLSDDADSVVVAAIGLEPIGDVGLLRSLVVSDVVRKQGLAAQLVGALEEKARQAGIGRLFLLTIDADGYFVRSGFAVVDRADVPQAILATREFSELCPDDAVAMCKPLNSVTTSK